MHKIKHCRIAERKAPRLKLVSRSVSTRKGVSKRVRAVGTSQLVKTRFEEALILPPIMRKDFKENKK
jgi:hypothetical protein